LQDKKWQSLNEQTNDPSAYMELDLGELKTNADASDNQAPVIVRNIPPYDLTADTSEKAYLLDEIIPKNIRSHLLEILGHLESGEFSSKGYGKFVTNRVHKLENLQVRNFSFHDPFHFTCLSVFSFHVLTCVSTCLGQEI
jgi:DNA-directed RNA polymerase I subunit RPA49